MGGNRPTHAKSLAWGPGGTYCWVMGRITIRRPAIGLVAACFVMALTGCGGATESGIEQLIESQGGGDVDLDLDSDGGFSVQTEEGGMSIDEDGNFVITDADGSVVTGDVDAEGGGINLESDEGSFSSGTTTELPDDWPSEIPEPDGLTISSAMVIGSDAEQAISVTGSVDGDAFVDSYADALTSAGFEEEEAFTSANTIRNLYVNATWTVTIFYVGDQSDNLVTVSVNSR